MVIPFDAFREQQRLKQPSLEQRAEALARMVEEKLDRAIQSGNGSLSCIHVHQGPFDPELFALAHKYLSSRFGKAGWNKVEMGRIASTSGHTHVTFFLIPPE